MQSTKRPHTPHSDHKELSPPGDMENVSEDEVNNLDKNKREREKLDALPMEDNKDHSPVVEDRIHMDVEEFEPILSDEEIVDDSETYQDMDYDYSAYTNNDDLIKLFVPGITEIQKYQKQETVEISDGLFNITENLRTTIAIVDDFFKSSITKYTVENFEKCNAEIKEEFIHLCEKISNMFGDVDSFCDICVIYTKLKEIDVGKLKETDKEITVQVQHITETLVEWLKIALNYTLANAQEQPGYKIRHIKCGVRLSEWCSNSTDFIKLLWKQDFMVHAVLLDLYGQEYMALSIKLMILRALDTYLLKSLQ